MVTTLVAVPEVEVCWGNGAVAGRGSRTGALLSHVVAAPAELAEEDLSLVEAEGGHFGEERHLARRWELEVIYSVHQVVLVISPIYP